MGQDLNIGADLLVPADAAGHATQAGPYFRNRAAFPNDGIVGGSSSGYWILLHSTGNITVHPVNSTSPGFSAYTARPTSFNSGAFHSLEAAFQGTTLQVALDGKLQTFDSALDGGSTTSVTIPATSGSNQGTAGIGFQAGANRGEAGGQRVDDLVVSTFASLSLPVENNFTSALDYGDAPNPGGAAASGNYHTKTTFNGPSHVIVPGLRMGATVDGENNAFPNSTATGDDGNNSDDEDAIAGAITAFIGTVPTVNVAVTNTTGAAATLYGWIDYNSNGLFDNATERASVAVPNGTNGAVALSFPTVPSGSASSTFARFRLSTDTRAQNPVGAASNGEVEDYQVTITAPPTVTYDFTAGTFSAAEGNATNTTNAVMLTRSDTSLAETVDVVLANGTAAAGSDFTAGPVTVSYGVGDATKPVPIEILGDTTVEPGENLNLSLTNFSGIGQVGTTNPVSALTITNDDVAIVTLSANDPNAVEATDHGQFTVSMNNTSDAATQIGYSIGGSAGNGADYTTLGGSVTILANQSSATIDVNVVEDLLLEGNETVTLTLTTVSGNPGISVGAANSDTVTITDNESVTVAFDSATSSLTEATVGHPVQVRLGGAAGVTLAPGVSVTANVVDDGTGSASGGSDYSVFGTQVASFGPGAVVGDLKPVTLSVAADSVVEPNEDVDLRINSVTGPGASSGSQTTHEVSILDDDSLSVEFSQASGNDAETSGGNLPQFSVTGQVQAGHTVSVSAAVTGGSATATDFTGPSMLNVGGGTYSAMAFAIPSLAISHDSIVEPGETIDLGNITGSAVSVGPQNSTTYTINDDDSLSVEFSQASGNDAETSGGNLPQFSVTGQVQAGHTVSVSAAVTGGSATATDFTGPSMLNVGGGTYSAMAFAIPSLAISHDSIVEPGETIDLGNITGSAVSVGPQNSTTYTINDDDTLTVEFSQAIGSDAEASGGNLPQFVVTGEVQAGHSVSVNTAVTGGSATAADFTAPSMLNVGGGTYPAQLFVIPGLSIVDDGDPEVNETIDLGNISGSAVSVGNANGDATTQSSTIYLFQGLTPWLFLAVPPGLPKNLAKDKVARIRGHIASPEFLRIRLQELLVRASPLFRQGNLMVRLQVGHQIDDFLIGERL